MFFSVSHDHLGNAGAQWQYGARSLGSARFRFPALGADDLYYNMRHSFTDADGSPVSVEIFMLDTVQWVGLRTECHTQLQTTDAGFEALWENPSQPMALSWEETKARCAGHPSGSCCLVDAYYAYKRPPPDTMALIGTECDEAAWPDKDHGLVCGSCKVLVNHFIEKYVSQSQPRPTNLLYLILIDD